jgi:hypothetical protein
MHCETDWCRKCSSGGEGVYRLTAAIFMISICPMSLNLDNVSGNHDRPEDVGHLSRSLNIRYAVWLD